MLYALEPDRLFFGRVMLEHLFDAHGDRDRGRGFPGLDIVPVQIEAVLPVIKQQDILEKLLLFLVVVHV